MGVAGSATVSAGSLNSSPPAAIPTRDTPPTPIGIPDRRKARSHPRCPAAGLATAAAAPPKSFPRSDAPAWSRARHVSRMVRRHVAKPRPQQLVGGHSLIELHHQGLLHLRSLPSS